MLLAAIGLSLGATVLVAARWGLTAGAAAAVASALLIVPPASVGVAGVRWHDLLLLVVLGGMLAWHVARDGRRIGGRDRVPLQWVDLIIAATVCLPASPAPLCHAYPPFCIPLPIAPMQKSTWQTLMGG